MKVARKEGVSGIRIVEHNRVLFWVIIGLIAILILMLIYIRTHPSETDDTINDGEIIINNANNELIDGASNSSVNASQNLGDASKNNVGIANPASVYCVDNGGELEIRTDADGGQAGICILQNGTECDEWKYYRGEC